MEEMESTVMNWKKFASDVGVSEKLSKAIDKTIKEWNQ
jgi:hypothetical protein